MTILLTILKVIGIILLVLLAVILALLLLVLFFPVTYGVRGKLEEEIRIRGKVSWLFSLIALRFEVINKEAHVQMSILGIFKKNIFPAEEHPKPKKKSRKKDEQEEPSEETTASIQAAEIPVEQDLQQETSEQQKEQQKESEQQEQRQNRSRKKKDGKSLKKYLPWNIIRTWIQKMKAFFFSLKKNFSNIKFPNWLIYFKNRYSYFGDIYIFIKHYSSSLGATLHGGINPSKLPFEVYIPFSAFSVALLAISNDFFISSFSYFLTSSIILSNCESTIKNILTARITEISVIKLIVT